MTTMLLTTMHDHYVQEILLGAAENLGALTALDLSQNRISDQGPNFMVGGWVGGLGGWAVYVCVCVGGGGVVMGLDAGSTIMSPLNFLAGG